MDFITISTAVVLLAILLAWYALLEYEERRQRKDSERPKRLSERGVRQASRGRGQDVGGDAAQKLWRSNGRRPLTGMSSFTRNGERLVFQGMLYRNGLAVMSVLLACLFVTLGNLLFSFPPLIFFGAAVAFTFTFGDAPPASSPLSSPRSSATSFSSSLRLSSRWTGKYSGCQPSICWAGC